DPTLTPARFRAEWEPIVHAHALHANLEAARAAGEAVHYLACDVTDAAAVAARVAEVRRRFGRIGGLVHGARVERSPAIAPKSPAVIDATVRVKVGGLAN